LVLFHKPEVVAVRTNDPLGKIALAEDGVAGDQSPLENDSFEQSKGCLVLVGLVLAAVRNGCLGQR
jgi:hypothetical protein